MNGIPFFLHAYLISKENSSEFPFVSVLKESCLVCLNGDDEK